MHKNKEGTGSCLNVEYGSLKEGQSYTHITLSEGRKRNVKSLVTSTNKLKPLVNYLLGQ